ncbi:MAG: PKD domain-containing protein [Flavobacteriales bacterium]|nr:PKD domain-containing protein [Flavobacteriales bacterium]
MRCAGASALHSRLRGASDERGHDFQRADHALHLEHELRGDGNYSFLWEFGDGATSTDPWPVHAYEGNGPYVMCLTLTDGSGCASTFCDTLSLDEFGIFGLVTEGDRAAGFIVAVQSGSAPTSLEESTNLGDLAAWPNPVADQLTIQLTSKLASIAEVIVLDMNGRLVDRSSWNMGSGRNQFVLSTASLVPGTYVCYGSLLLRALLSSASFGCRSVRKVSAKGVVVSDHALSAFRG